ncbi:unnamed protein product [Soboliphyme baturini]|uniref:Uncharacterized protein n=1 Tax=Soboliphyme baturini TaxID=241478 RepID=A0A183IL66_9BILA|nr:unnamed protein product [Soboliphyme baturini]
MKVRKHATPVDPDPGSLAGRGRGPMVGYLLFGSAVLRCALIFSSSKKHTFVVVVVQKQVLVMAKPETLEIARLAAGFASHKAHGRRTIAVVLANVDTGAGTAPATCKNMNYATSNMRRHHRSTIAANVDSRAAAHHTTVPNRTWTEDEVEVEDEVEGEDGKGPPAAREVEGAGRANDDDDDDATPTHNYRSSTRQLRVAMACVAPGGVRCPVIRRATEVLSYTVCL